MNEEILTRVVVDCSTNTSEVIPLTEEEIVEYQTKVNASIEREMQMQSEAQAKAEAKASGIAKLLALGLTEEEANALVK